MSNMMTKQTKEFKCNFDEIEGKIKILTQYQKPAIPKMLMKMASWNIDNVNVICEYIVAEQNEIGIKESTKEGKIKCLVRLSSHLNHKSFKDMTKDDILSYLNSLKKPECEDPNHRSIGTL